MYAQLRIFDTGNDSADELIARLQSDIASVYTACDGFVGYFVVGSHSHTIETVRIFYDKLTFDAATEAAHAAQEQIAADLAPDVDDYRLAGEIVISEWA